VVLDVLSDTSDFFSFSLTWAVAVKNSKRKFVVLSSLVGVLTLTSALLLALAPPPLSAETSSASLDAVYQNNLVETLFNTQAPPQPGHWKYIYIHHSAAASGSAAEMAQSARGLVDHFVIGNGQGCQDGEIQVGPRWTSQSAPAAPLGADRIDPDCVSICLVGNFDAATPTPAQLRQLGQLVRVLQNQLGIAADHVVTVNDAPGASGVGQYFPTTSFREAILP
jgi:hypothetical protein